MSLYIAIPAVVLSIVIITYGANFFTDGSSSIAKKLRISPLIIGLTIVAFGTSAPEFSVSFASSLMGSSGISLGNVLGSNIFNILIVLGGAAMVRPLTIQRSTLRLELPFLVIIGVLFLFMAKDSLLFPGKPDRIDRVDGVVLLLLFALFLFYIIRLAKRKPLHNKELEAGGTSQEKTFVPPIKEYGWLLSLGLFVLGLAMLVAGSKLFTESAVAIARAFHISDVIIGITLVAIGTSIPELATSVAAALKNQVDIAVGNVVGSNIFNLLLIPGVVSLVTPIDSASASVVDFCAVIVSSVMLLLFIYGDKQRRLRSPYWILLFLGYIAYTIYLISIA